MNRIIKFRGKRIENNEWVYGFLVNSIYINIGNPNSHIFVESESLIRINDETVGQFTELPNNIFEGDIIKSEIHLGTVFIVIWNDYNKCFSAFDRHQYQFMQECELGRRNALANNRSVDPDWITKYRYVPIGNIHDNPELLGIK